MKRILLVLLLTLMLTGCVNKPSKSIETYQCNDDCKDETILVQVSKKIDYHKQDGNYYTYNFTVVSTQETFEKNGDRYFYLTEKFYEGQIIYAMQKNNELWFIPLS